MISTPQSNLDYRFVVRGYRIEIRGLSRETGDFSNLRVVTVLTFQLLM